MTEKSEAGRSGARRKWARHDAGASNVTAREGRPGPEGERLMEAVVARENMARAYARVVQNKGAAGVDGMEVGELKPYLQGHWDGIKKELLEGKYRPQAVRKVEIPKPGGGMRMLGIPTVVDRLIQQAVSQVMTPIFDRHFSQSSYGFREGRNAHQAIMQARRYVADGKRWVVDIDLEKFFDRVNHDVLMSRVARRVQDKQVLRLIRRYLQAGIMSDGVVAQRAEGTPQGGPLSPLLSNILLDDLDKELERRGHTFCRYADDSNVYVRSRIAGERVMDSLKRYLERKLRLRVNEAKSAVARPWQRTFLGYSMTSHTKPKLTVARSSVQRFKEKVRGLIRKGKGLNIGSVIMELQPFLRGWVAYFKLAEAKNVFEELDGWIRRKLRCLLWRQWKRVYPRARRLMQRGIAEARAWQSATNGRGPWWNSGASHMNEAYPHSFFAGLGLPALLQERLKLHYSL
jgi:group II intron reverse transcriptase/maturase